MIDLNFDTKKSSSIAELKNLRKLTKQAYFFDSSKNKTCRSLHHLKHLIETELEQISKQDNAEKKCETLKKRALTLVEVTKEFKQNCWFGNKHADNALKDFSLWAFNLSIQVKMTEDQKKLAHEHDEKIENLKRLTTEITQSLPDFETLKKLPFDEIIALEKKLLALLPQIPEDDKTLGNLWLSKKILLSECLYCAEIRCDKKKNSSLLQSFRNNLEKISIFSLVNLGGCDASDNFLDKKLLKNSRYNLSFIIRFMKQILYKDEVPPQEKKAFIRLLNSYKAGYRLKNYQHFKFQTDQSHLTTEEVLENKKKIKRKLRKELETNCQVTVSTGYTKEPHGHEIALNLFVRKDSKGDRFVRGEIVNRGEGVENHGEFRFQDWKKRINPYIQLGEVSLDALIDSDFIDVLFELDVLKTPKNTVLSFHNETHYTSNEFYDIVLPMWPTKNFSSQNVEKECRGFQKGTTCSFKAYLTPFRDIFSHEFARLCKLKMRMIALELYLGIDDPKIFNASFIEWTLKKIFLTLKKLEKKQEDSKKFPSYVAEELSILRKHCHFLEVLAQTKGEKTIAVHFIEPDMTEPQTVNIDYLKNSQQPKTNSSLITSKTHHIPKKFNSLNDVQNFFYSEGVTEYGNNGINCLKNFIKNFAYPFLRAIPICSDKSFWCPSYSIMRIYETKTIRNIELILSLFCKPSLNSSISAPKLVVKLNILVGILLYLKNLNHFDDLYIADRAWKILEMLKTAHSQLRTGLPECDEIIEVVQTTLSELVKKPGASLKILETSDGFFYVESFPCQTLEELQEDVVAYDRYNRIKSNTQTDKLATDVDLIANAMKNYPIYIDTDIETILLKLHENLIFDIGISRFFGKSDNLNLKNNHLELIHQLYRESTVDQKPKSRMTYFQKRLNYSESPLKESARYGILVDQLFPWDSHDHLIVRELLDERLEWRGQSRLIQNQQVKASQECLKFAGTTLKTQEINRFLSILCYPESFVLQIIHSFSLENSFSRLSDPRFQALLQGFFLTKNSKGESLLTKNLKENKTIISTLFDYFEISIKRSNQNKWTEAHLFFILLLGQILAYSSELTAEIDEVQLNNGLKILHEGILLFDVENSSPEHQNVYRHWLIALYPFIHRRDNPINHQLVQICEKAYLNYNKNYQYYDFNKRLLLNDYFQLGIEALELKTNVQIRPIPYWILKHIEREAFITCLKPGLLKLTIEGKSEQQLKYNTSDESVKRYKKFNGKYYLQQDLHKCTSLPQLLRYTKAWMRPSNKEVIFESSERNILARLENNTLVHPKYPDLIHVSKINKPLYAYFMKLDLGILIWKNRLTNCVELIELPISDLSFKREVNSENDVVWLCPQHDHMRVDFHCKIDELEPLAYYIVLSNEKRKIVLIAANRVLYGNKSPKAHFEPLSYEMTDGSIYILPLKHDQLVLPYDAKIILHLVYLALVSHQYRQAFQLIKKLERLGPDLHPEAILMLNTWFDITDRQPDKSINASVLRIRLKIFAIKLKPINKEIEINQDSLRHDYLRCLDDQIVRSQSWPSVQDELLLINSLDNWKSLDTIKRRKGHLEGILNGSGINPYKYCSVVYPKLKYKPHFKDCIDYGKHLLNWFTQPEFVDTNKTKKERLNESDLKQKASFDWISETIASIMLTHFDSPQPIGFRTRPGENFIYNFLYYYKIAYASKPEKDFSDLMNLLRLSRNGVFPEVEILRKILLGVALISQHSKSKPLPAFVKFISNKKPLGKKLQDVCSPDELYEDTGKAILNDINLLRLQLRILYNTIETQSNLLKEFQNSWSLYEFSKQERRGAKWLQPKSAVVTFNKLPAMKQSATLASELEQPILIDFKKIALSKGFIVEQDKNLQKINIETEIDCLHQILEVYQADGLQSRVVEGIIEKIDELKASLKYPVYLLPISVNHKAKKNKQLWVKTQKWIKDAFSEIASKITPLRKEIEEFANHRTLRTSGNLHTGFEKTKKLEVMDILIYIARKEEHKIIDANRELQGSRFLQLKQLVLSYLILTTDLQQLFRCEGAIDSILQIVNEDPNGWSSKAAQHAAVSLVSTLIQKRSYNPVKDLPILIYERMNDIRLHQEQYDALQTLTDNADFELEARTGFGKTKVLVPLWLLLKSKPGRITTFTTTASLLKDQELFLKDVLGDAFDKSFEVIDFSIEKTSNIPYLTWLDKRLKQAEKTGKKVFLLKIDSLHGITGLGLKDQIFKNQPGKLSAAIPLLASIREKFKKALNFIDESTECLKIRHTFEYANGLAKPVKLNHCQEAFNFFTNVVCSSEILSKFHFEFLSDEQYKAINQSEKIPTQIITEQNYDDQLLPQLVKATVKYLKVDKKNRKKLFSYLMGNNPKEGAVFFSKLSQRNKWRYAYCFHQLHEHLKITLLKNCGERYDIGNKRLALPLDGGSPKYKSEFASTNDLINFTFQANLKRPIDNQLVRNFIEYIQSHVYKHGFSSYKEDPRLSLFSKLRKSEKKLPKIVDLNKTHVPIIVDILNNPVHLKLRLQFIAVQILPLIRTYPEKISGNSFTLIDSLGTIHAASGTVNSQTLPSRIKTIEKKSAMVSNLAPIWNNSPAQILTIDQNKGAEFLDELLTKNTEHRTLIDAGGILRDLSPDKIVNILLTKTASWISPVKGIVYYDNNKVCMVWERGASNPKPYQQSNLSPDELYFYIRQSHAIGSDIAMPHYAKGLCTVNKETIEKFLFQAFGRMRRLNTGQTLGLVLTEEDASVIKTYLGLKNKPLSLKHLLIHAQKQEIRQNRKDYYFALKQYLTHCVERELWIAFEEKKINLAQLSKGFHLLKPLLTQETEKDPFRGLFTNVTEVDAAVAVNLLKKSVLDPLRELVRKDGYFGLLRKIIQFKRIESTFDKYLKYDYLENKILVGETSADERTCEVESEKLQDQQQDVENETALSATSDLVPQDPELWDGNYKKLLDSSSGEQIFGIKVVRSPNLPIIFKSSLQKKARGIKFEERIFKPAYQFILKIDSKGVPSLLAMDLYDMGYALERMQNENGGKSESQYYMISNNKIIASENKNKNFQQDLRKVIINKTFLAKIGAITRILSGSDSFSNEERKWLINYYKQESQEHRDSLTTLLSKTVCSWPQQEGMRAYLERCE